MGLDLAIQAEQNWIYRVQGRKIMDQDLPAQIQEMACRHFIGSEAGGFN